MRKNRKPITTQTKIEVDEKTNEPLLVDVPIDKLPNQTSSSEEESLLTPKDGTKEENYKKQLKMKMNFIPKKEDSVSKRQHVFKVVTYVVFIVFIVGVLAYTAYNDFFAQDKEFPSWEMVGEVLSQNWYYIIFALFCVFLCIFLKGLKLSIMCKNTTGKWHLKTCMETGMIGIYYNNVTPLAVGGQPFEIYNLSKHGIHKGVSSALPIATFFLNQFAFVILGVAALILYNFNVLNVGYALKDGVNIIAIIGLSTCLLMPLLVVIFSLMPRVGAWLVKIVVKLGSKLRIIKNPELTNYKFVKSVVYNTKCLKKIAKSPWTFISTFLLSFGEQLAMSSIAYFTLRFFGFDWPAWSVWEWAQVIQMCIILYAAVSFIPTPGNSGAADLSFYVFFEAGLLAGFAFPAMVVWRLLSYYSFIIIGFSYLTIKKRKEKKLAKSEAFLSEQK